MTECNILLIITLQTKNHLHILSTKIMLSHVPDLVQWFLLSMRVIVLNTNGLSICLDG